MNPFIIYIFMMGYALVFYISILLGRESDVLDNCI
jgi:hypothetical protein